MTADERIEKLLNRFGQTISDLPEPTVYYRAYTGVHRAQASETALKWHEEDDSPQEFIPDVLKVICCTDYICHLADVIDRMEAALETAANNFDCFHCYQKFLEDAKCCDFGIDDEFLDDRISEEEDE